MNGWVEDEWINVSDLFENMCSTYHACLCLLRAINFQWKAFFLNISIFYLFIFFYIILPLCGNVDVFSGKCRIDRFLFLVNVSKYTVFCDNFFRKEGALFSFQHHILISFSLTLINFPIIILHIHNVHTNTGVLFLHSRKKNAKEK